jgi:integrase
MPRQRSGTLLAGKNADGSARFRFRLRLADGSKSERFDVPQGMGEKQARAFVAGLQAEEDAKGALLAQRESARRELARVEGTACQGEAADAWFERYLPSIECGEMHRRITRNNWRKWISPIIGAKPMEALTRDDAENVRDALDRALDGKTLRHSTARNVWSNLTGALKAAYASRDRSLRVHAAPLHFGILPPKRGESRQRPWLYPNEWQALATCEAVPVAWRQLYALALYSGLRPNELRALTWSDVDLAGGQISVSKAWDDHTKTVKAPKTAAGQRTIPIEPALAPILDALRGAPGANVAWLLSEGEHRVAGPFRDHLKLAGITRARLYADDETQEPVDFRSLRDSYATWLALAGVPDKRIQRRLGHASNSTTDRYIKAAESFDVATIGAPFPTLPVALAKPVRTSVWTTKAKSPGLSRGVMAPTVGLEPTTRRLTAACSTD